MGRDAAEKVAVAVASLLLVGAGGAACTPQEVVMSQPVVPDLRPLALVYSGPGACPGCPEALARVLAAAGLRVRYVSASDLSGDQMFDGVTLYAQPGGDDTQQVYDAFGPGPFADFSAAMKAFLGRGGRYLGVCLGGFLAGQWIDDAATIPALRLFAGDAAYFRATPRPAHLDQVIPVTWLVPQPAARWVYFQEGPCFRFDATDAGLDGGADAGPGPAVWSTYQNDSVAAFIAPHGAGRVALSGFHFEADLTWYQEHHLVDPDGVDFDLGVALVKALVGP